MTTGFRPPIRSTARRHATWRVRRLRSWRTGLVAAAAGAAMGTSGLVGVPAGASAAADYSVSGPNLAAIGAGGHAEVSSALSGYPASALNDEKRQTNLGYWNDATQREFPDWAQISWDEPQVINQVALRLPVYPQLSTPQRTVGPLHVSYWDAESDAWVPFDTTNGTPNPVQTWVAPTTSDGSQIKAFGFADVTTNKIRVTFSGGNSDGWSLLEEIEAYKTAPAQAPFAIRTHTQDQADAAIPQPGDTTAISAKVVDAHGYAISGYPITFSTRSGGGEILGTDADAHTPGMQVTTDISGIASTQAETGPRPGINSFEARISDSKKPIRFRLRTLSLQNALRKSLSWLKSAAAKMEAGSRRTATDGTVMYTPDASASYAAFWPRDFTYMLEGYPQGIPLEDIRAGVDYLMRAQRADGAMPDHVADDGDQQYCPGNDHCVTYGPSPTADNSAFMVKAAYHYYRLSGDISLFTQHAEGLVKAMEFTTRSPNNSLVYIDPAFPGSPYGFTDAIKKTGDLLFTSLLQYEAASNLAEMFTAVNDRSAAQHWRHEAEQIKTDVQSLYDPDSGMFLAASLSNRQIDVWGSAYAAYLDVATPEQQTAISHYLVDNYEGIVRRGQVRHTAPGTFWESASVGQGVYQNGAYWATASGWVADSIDKTDHTLARQMLVDLTKDFIANGINEAFNDDLSYVAVRDYVASATNPIPVMKRLARHHVR